MGYDWSHSGSVRLKPGSTLQDVLNVYACEDEPHLPLTPDGEIELEDGHVSLKVQAEFLDYSASGESISLDEAFTDFLQTVADELAIEGWIDYQLEEYEIPFGPTDLAKAQARLANAKSALQIAQRELAMAEEQVQRLETRLA